MGDGAYDTQPVLATHIFPPRKNVFAHTPTRLPLHAGALVAIFENWMATTAAALVEIKTNCINRPVNELQSRAAILNRFTELCSPQTVAMG